MIHLVVTTKGRTIVNHAVFNQEWVTGQQRGLQGKSMQNVAMFGFYDAGNFGDDLMAVLLGLSLREAGVRCTTFGLDGETAGDFGLSATRNVDHLLEDVGIVVWGGGGLLVSWNSLVYRLLYGGFAASCDDLLSGIAKRRLRKAAISVGGDGTFAGKLSPAYKQAFVEGMEYASTRNRSDLETLRHFGVRRDFFPDIVWQTADRFPVEPLKRGAVRIGIDLYFRSLIRHGGPEALFGLQDVARQRKDAEFILIDNTNSRRRAYRGLGRVLCGRNCQPYQFRDILEDLRMIASLDLLISSRLHTLMVALGYGVPAISFAAEEKTRLMLQEIGRPELYYGSDRLQEMVSILTHKERLEKFVREFSFDGVQQLRRLSYGHQQRLIELLV